MANLARVLRTAALIALIGVAFLWMFTPLGHPPASDRARVSRVYNDMRTVSLGLDAYHLDHGAYPAPVASKSGWTVLPPVLTTPVAYLAMLPGSPFLPQGETFGYALVGDDEEAWGELKSNLDFEPVYVLLSPGPTRERGPFRLDWSMVYDPTNGAKSPGHVVRFGWGSTVEESARSGQNMLDHAPNAKAPALTYDPTNGAITRCEGWTVKQ